jgi:hypothetical protein
MFMTTDNHPGKPKLVGRPSKISKELTQRLCEMIEIGMPYTLACEAAGISFDAYNNWKKKGEAGEPKFVEFYERVKKAKATCALNCLKRINEKILKNNSPYYDTWLLSRRFYQDFGERQHITSDNKSINENLNVNVDNADTIRKEILEKLALFREKPKPSTDSEFSSQFDILY